MTFLDRFAFYLLIGIVRLFVGRENAVEFAAWLEPLIDSTIGPATQRHCWFDFEDGHTCMLPSMHDGTHQPTPDEEIIIEVVDPQ
jgi:hypothetical protein